MFVYLLLYAERTFIYEWNSEFCFFFCKPLVALVLQKLVSIFSCKMGLGYYVHADLHNMFFKCWMI